VLLFYRDKISKTRSHKHFANPQEIEDFFKGRGAKKVKVVDSEQSNNTLYLITRK
jgi:hypothetical protein